MRYWRSVVGAVLTMALLVGAERAVAQSYPVTFSMQSIIEGFFGEDGLVSFGFYDAAFVPPGGELQAEVVLADADGNVLARHSFFDTYRMETQVFARIGVVGPADVQLTEPGVYNIFFFVDGEIATRMPFVLKAASDGSDPFDPAKTYTFDGFWRQLGYVTPPGGSGYDGPLFTFWTGGPDLADPETTESYIAVLSSGDEVLFHSKRAAGHIPEGAFRRSNFNLFHPHEAGEEANAEVFSTDDLAALDGDYLLRILRESDNSVLRNFRLTVTDGELQQHERAVLGYEPRMDFLLPRVPKLGSSAYEMVEAIWIESR